MWLILDWYVGVGRELWLPLDAKPGQYELLAGSASSPPYNWGQSDGERPSWRLGVGSSWSFFFLACNLSQVHEPTNSWFAKVGVGLLLLGIKIVLTGCIR